MSTRLQPGAARQTRIQSSALQTLTTLAHPISMVGEYAVTVMQNDEHVASFDVLVTEDSTAPQVNVDLAYLSLGRATTHHLRPGGAIVFYVSKGRGGFSVRIRRMGDPSEACAYDSRNLHSSDLFVVTPASAGEHEVCDRGARHRAIVRVIPYPPGQAMSAPPVPAQLRLTASGFDRSSLEIHLSQELAVTIDTDHASIVVSGPLDI